MQHLKHHAAHLLMCAPMLVVALVLIAGGASIASLVPVIACMLMMGVMIGYYNLGSFIHRLHKRDKRRQEAEHDEGEADE